MKNYTMDDKRGFGLPVYFEAREELMRSNNSMLRLVYISEGNGIIKLNDETIVFSAPAMFCLNELDKIELQQTLKLAAQAVYFHPAVINDTLQFVTVRNESAELSLSEYRDYFLIIPFIERGNYSSANIQIGHIASKKVSRLFKSMKEELTFMETEYWPCRFRAFLLETLFLIQDMITDSKSRLSVDIPEPDEEISNIILYLHANYDKKITIEELTDIFHINRTTLSAKFRKSMGISIIEYLVKYRIKVAETMLRDTMLPVAEILNRVGFRDSVHFARMFKKHTGYTPSGYRERYLIQNVE